MPLYSFLDTDQELCQSLASELKQARKDSIKVAARKASQAKQKQGGGSGNNSPGSGSPGTSRTTTTTSVGSGSPNGGSVLMGTARAPEGYDEGTAAQAAILATLGWNDKEESVDNSAYTTGSGLKSALDATDEPMQTEQSV